MRVVIRDYRIVSVVELNTGNPISSDFWTFYKTGDELSEIAMGIDPDSVAWFAVDYDQKYGLPTRIFIDLDSNIVDEEYGFTSEFVSRE